MEALESKDFQTLCSLFIPCVEWGVGDCWASHSAGDKLLTGATLLPPFLSSMRPGSKAVSQQPQRRLHPVPCPPPSPPSWDRNKRPQGKEG